MKLPSKFVSLDEVIVAVLLGPDSKVKGPKMTLIPSGGCVCIKQLPAPGSKWTKSDREELNKIEPPNAIKEASPDPAKKFMGELLPRSISALIWN